MCVFFSFFMWWHLHTVNWCTTQNHWHSTCYVHTCRCCCCFHALNAYFFKTIFFYFSFTQLIVERTVFSGKNRTNFIFNLFHIFWSVILHKFNRMWTHMFHVKQEQLHFFVVVVVPSNLTNACNQGIANNVTSIRLQLYPLLAPLCFVIIFSFLNKDW